MSEYLGSISAGVVNAPKNANVFIFGPQNLAGGKEHFRAVPFRCPKSLPTESIADSELRQIVEASRSAYALLAEYSGVFFDTVQPTDQLNQEFVMGVCRACPIFSILVAKLKGSDVLRDVLSTDILSGDAAETEKQMMQQKYRHQRFPASSPGEANYVHN